MNAIEGTSVRHELTSPGFMQAINALEKSAMHTLYQEYATVLYSYAWQITHSHEESA